MIDIIAQDQSKDHCRLFHQLEKPDLDLLSCTGKAWSNWNHPRGSKTKSCGAEMIKITWSCINSKSLVCRHQLLWRAAEWWYRRVPNHPQEYTLHNILSHLSYIIFILSQIPYEFINLDKAVFNRVPDLEEQLQLSSLFWKFLVVPSQIICTFFQRSQLEFTLLSRTKCARADSFPDY